MLRYKNMLFVIAISMLAMAIAVIAQDAPAGRGGRNMMGGRRGMFGGMTSDALNDYTSETILLWEDGAPGAMGDSEADKPNMTFYQAKDSNNTGASIIIVPGGAYRGVAIPNEGIPTAAKLLEIGVNVFILRYRVAPYQYPIELNDAQRAIRIARSCAEEFGIDPKRIGMMGFSAGGHLTSTAGTHYDAGNLDSTDPIERASSKPDFLALIYPVISFQTNINGQSPLRANAGTGRNLLGDNPDQALVDDLSNELKVNTETPPTFLVHGTADRLVSVQHSVQFYLALLKAGVPTELHTFEKGGHGFGAGGNDPALQIWPTLLENWLRGRGLLENSN